MEMDPIKKETSYNKDGKYQNIANIEELVQKWNPIDMLPRIYSDYELFEK